MPKRTRDDQVKGFTQSYSSGICGRNQPNVSAPLSAFARRQLQQQQNEAVKASESIQTAAPPFQQAIPKPTEFKTPAAPSEDAGGKIPRAASDRSASPKPGNRFATVRKGLESALQRQLANAQRRKGEAAIAAAVTAAEGTTSNDVGDEDASEDKDGDGNADDLMSVDGDEDEGEDRGAVRVERLVVNGRVRPTPKTTLVSTFVPTSTNPVRSVFPTGRAVYKYRLIPCTKLVFEGEFTLRVVHGAITIAGATITPQFGIQTVFAPSTHALPVIEAVESLPERKRKKGKKRRGGGKKEEEEEEEAEGEVVIEVGCCETGLRGIGGLCPMFAATLLAPRPKPSIILIAGPKSTGKSTFSRFLANYLLTHPTPFDTSNAFTSYPIRNVAYLDLDPGQPEFSPPGVISLSLLSSQTPILGPPFTHPAGPAGPGRRVRAQHTGFVTMKEDPGYYISCVQDLFDVYRRTLETDGVGLVVNTCGWVKGMGAEVLNDVVGIIKPTDIVVLELPARQEYRHGNLGKKQERRQRYIHSLRTLPAALSSQKFTAADLRNLQMTAYFHHRAHIAPTTHEDSSTSLGPFPYQEPEPEPSTARITFDFSNPLTHTPPHTLPFLNTKVHIMNFSAHAYPPYTAGPSYPSEPHPDDSLSPRLLADAIEGTLVAVTTVPKTYSSTSPPHNYYPPTSQTPVSNSASREPAVPASTPMLTLTPVPPDPSQTTFYALALIRAIDLQSGVLHLVFPHHDRYVSHPETESDTEVLLVRGRLDVPIWDFVHREAGWGTAGSEMPWVVMEDGGEGGGAVTGVGAVGAVKVAGGKEWRARRNLMRRGQMRGRGRGGALP
ncbi:hypothetical protein BDZ91DRAFT_794528 [Kalaharituber pfeilii]|nr:hypothetical protein BDZ91DRAFT_794528 [Kalaharituber pfeilii]